MPRLRLFGNSVLSFVSKAVSGYWDIMDPTNGYTAIHAAALRRLPLEKLDRRYFFESDMLFRLNIVRAVVRDVPMPSFYGEEASSLKIRRVAMEFPVKYVNRFLKRIFYNYFLRDFNAGTVELLLGGLLLAGGAGFGAWHWYLSMARGLPATSGTVMVAALPILLGFQLLISAINYDIASVPRRCLQKELGYRQPPVRTGVQGAEVHGRDRNPAGHLQRPEILAEADRIHPAAVLSAMEAADQR